MPKITTATATPLQAQLDRLAAFEPTSLPVLSLYLNMQPDQHGRDRYDLFLRDAFPRHARSYRSGSPERKSFEEDVHRIDRYLQSDLKPSANGAAIFACSGKDRFFEAIELQAPLDEHWLHVGAQPHLYPLARLNDQYPRYAALALDTNSARLFVFALGRPQRKEQVQGVKTRRTSIGGLSQNRYQRHAENFHLHHVKEVVAVLDRVVRDEKIQHIVVTGDEEALPLLKRELPKHLAEKVIDLEKDDVRVSEREIFEDAFAALRRRDAETDAEKVDEVTGAWRGKGLGVVGVRDTLRALEMGRVEELLISASPDLLKQQKSSARAASAPDPSQAPDVSIPLSAVDGETARLAGELVTRAQQTGARVRFIEDRSLLAGVGGVAALLRYRV